MNNPKCLPLCILAMCVLLFAPFLHSDSHYKYTLAPNMDFYFAHISYTEVRKDGNDPLVYREGSLESEIAVLNLPLGPGDTIQTTSDRQCEIQFDTGTLVRLDKDTSVKIETVIAESLSSGKKLTNLVLINGHVYVMYKRYNRGEVFQIITPNTAIKLNHNAVGIINAKDDGSTSVQIKEGKGYVMYGPDEKHLEKQKLKKHQTLTVSPDDTIVRGPYEQDVSFELWNENMNKDFVAMHKGVTFIPDPIYKYPKSVVYFAQKYSNLYGEWKWNSLYGFVWTPNYARKYPWGGWQPYTHGRWCTFDNQLFWVPQEPWGWVPYHLGVWIWDKDIGWMWIPGDAFAPAWVTWEFFAGYYMWKPWSLYDWYYASLSYPDRGYYGNPWAYYPAYNAVSPPNRRHLVTKIKKDQLKDNKNAGIPTKPPESIKRAYDNLVKALEKNDGRILATIKDIPNQIVVVTSKDINADAIHEKRLSVAEVPFKQLQDVDYLTQETNPYRSAYRIYKINEVIRSVADRVISGKSTLKSHVFLGADSSLSPSISKSITGKGIQKEQTSLQKMSEISHLPGPTPGAAKIGSIRIDPKIRFRDWNPDVAYARRAGITIQYSSRTNEVFCPDLGISSRGVVATSAGRISTHRSGPKGAFETPSFSTSLSSDSSSTSESSSTSSSDGSKSASSSSGEKKK